MDYDKLIEQLNAWNEQHLSVVCRGKHFACDYLCENEDCIVVRAANAIETLRAENAQLRAELEQKEKYYEQMIDALSATDSADLAQMTACVYYKPGGLCRYGGDDPANVCVLGPCPHERTAEEVLADLARVTSERDAAQALLAERSGVTGSAPITTAFGVPLDRLRELVKADRDGRCVVLPCKDWLDIVFGDQEVFYGIDAEYIENPIRQISVDSSARCTWYDGWKTVVLKGYDENGFDWEFSPEEIGKTVFLTRDEAESALKAKEQE